MLDDDSDLTAILGLDSHSESLTDRRNAAVIDCYGHPIAACLVLSVADLRRLGIPPEGTAEVVYWVVGDNQLTIRTSADIEEQSGDHSTTD